MPRALSKRYLSEKEAERLYEKYPEMKGGNPELYCPTCSKKGEYVWKDEIHVCDCRTQLNLYKNYLNAGIGVLYQRQSWEDYEGDQELAAMAKMYLENAELMVSRGMGIILLGEYGVGKTMVLSLLIKDLLKAGYSAFSTTFTGMISMFTDGWKSESSQRLFEEKVEMSQILLLDDVGKEMRTKTNLSEATFDHILRTRAQNGRPTFITTNMSAAEMSEGYGSAVMSLLKENSVNYEVTGVADFRERAGNRSLKEVMDRQVRPIV